MNVPNYYTILGLDERASAQEIKAAYRKLAKRYHPDRNKTDADAESRFKEISEAYEVLGNSARRKEYDEMRTYAGTRSTGGARRKRNARTSPSPDPEMRTTMDGGAFSEADLADLLGMLYRGQGSPFNDTGRTTGGAQRFQFGGSFDPATFANDYAEHQNVDVHMELQVNLAQLLLGSALRLKTPAGKTIIFRIPACTQADATFRVPSMGRPHGDGFGDLYIRLRLVLPEKLTTAEQEHVRALAQSLKLKH